MPEPVDLIAEALVRAGKGGVREGGTGEILSNRGTAHKAARRIVDDLAEHNLVVVSTTEPLTPEAELVLRAVLFGDRRLASQEGTPDG